ncbi:MAG: PQQ-dependent sugar dehydrogenase [Burkholderiales bacterium]
MPRSTASYPGAIAAALLLFAACGGDSGGAPQPQAPPALGVQRVFPHLVFAAPVAMLQAPGDGTRWFVIEQAGRVRMFANEPGVAAARTFADISARVASGGEMGLLGMAFHPRFPADPRVFLSYTNDSAGRVSRISEFRLGGDGGLDPASERILLAIEQPESNHNGGQIAFGPDGYLYAGMGDGGGGNDRHGAIGNGQLMTTLLGKMLRIDVNTASGYGIPPDNPFAGNPRCGRSGSGAAHCPEIYASGLRNPWRWSFDRQTGELWVGDVGQNALEEIDRVVRGGNYGWRCFEGTRATGLACGSQPGAQPPIADYGRAAGRSVTGGYVYRGARIGALSGRYVFGDYVTGRIWHIAGDTPPTARVAGGFATDLSISSFGEGNDGELYVVHHGGELYRLTGS